MLSACPQIKTDVEFPRIRETENTETENTMERIDIIPIRSSRPLNKSQKRLTLTSTACSVFEKKVRFM